MSLLFIDNFLCFLPIFLLCNTYGMSRSVSYSFLPKEQGESQDDLFEAAFQGECREDAPCQQLCFDLHDGTFECSCRDGFTLFADGYSCIENSEYELLWNMNLSLTSTNEKQSLGNNKRIFHYVMEHKTNRTRKSQTTYKSLFHSRGRILKQHSDVDSQEHQNFEDIKNLVLKNLKMDKTDEGTTFNQPQDLERDDVMSSEEENSSVLPERKSQYSSKFPSKDFDGTTLQKSKNDLRNEFKENLMSSSNDASSTVVPNGRYSRESANSLTCDGSLCKHGGSCVLNSKGSSFECRCPIGWVGGFCEKAEDILYPKLRSHSYIALRIRKSNISMNFLKINIKFRPELYEGILLYIGNIENSDAENMFISIVLRNGILELRYSGESRVGTIRSDRPVVLNSWNTASLYFDEEKAWLQLNDGPRPQKQSKGIFPRINDIGIMYLGGYPHIPSSAYATDFPLGFQGCVRQLVVSEFMYTFNPSRSRDIIDGFDLEECRPVVCNSVSCLNGGQCTAVKPNWGTCLCPLGYGGDRCEKVFEILIPSFDGTSHLQYPGLASSSLTFTEIFIIFLPRSPNGSLLYNGYRINGTGDFLSLSLEAGYVVLKFDLGTGPSEIRSLREISMHQWHKVLITRTGRLGLMQVDDEQAQNVLSPGGYSQLSLPLNLYLGGVPSPKERASSAEVHDSFIGCVQRLLINGKPIKLIEQALSGVNINNCDHDCIEKPCLNGGTCIPQMDGYKCHCSTSYTGPNCKTEIVDMVKRPMFIGNSFLRYASESIVSRLGGENSLLYYDFRALSPVGLILWAGARKIDSSSDYMAIGLEDGYIRLDYNLGSGQVTLFYNQSRVDDGLWHGFKLIRYKQRGSITIDNKHMVTAVSPGPLKELNIPNELFLGGMQDIESKNAGPYSVGFTGCLSNLTFNDDYKLEFLTMASTGINIQPCV